MAVPADANGLADDEVPVAFVVVAAAVAVAAEAAAVRWFVAGAVLPGEILAARAGALVVGLHACALAAAAAGEARFGGGKASRCRLLDSGVGDAGRGMPWL